MNGALVNNQLKDLVEEFANQTLGAPKHVGDMRSRALIIFTESCKDTTVQDLPGGPACHVEARVQVAEEGVALGFVPLTAKGMELLAWWNEELSKTRLVVVTGGR